MSEEKVAASAARIPPHSANAEKSVLGSMMISQEAVAIATQTLKPEDFYFEIHKKIFECMLKLVRAGLPVDFVTLTDQMEKEGTLDALGGYDYVTELNRFVPTVAHAEEYVSIVADKSILRRLIAACGTITQESFESQDVTQVMQHAEQLIFSISQNRERKSFVSIQEAVAEELDKVENMMANPDAVIGLRSGYNSLDAWTGGFRGSELILLAARPSMGKTAFVLGIAEQVPRFNPNATVAIFSLEMPYLDLTARMLSAISTLSLQNIRTGRLNGGDDSRRLSDAGLKLSEASIYIDDTSSITVMEIRSKCRRLKMEHGLSLVIIDYLQLIAGAGGNAAHAGESYQQEVAAMTRALKIMARELDVPVILLSQLSRGPERRDPPKPILSDLRDSGAIEQDADMVIFLYREAYYAALKKEAEAQALTNEAEVIIAKNRNGPTGTVKLLWDASNATFREIDSDAMRSRLQE